MVSLLDGNYVTIDHSDGASMIFTNVHNHTWFLEALTIRLPS